MSSMVIKIVKSQEELAVAKGELMGAGYSVVIEKASDIIAIDLSKFDSEETILNDAIAIIGYAE